MYTSSKPSNRNRSKLSSLSFPIYSAASIQRFFHENGKSIRKRWGQNFLIDPNISRRIADCILRKERNPLWEIGPGFGVLTEEIISRGHTVYGVEIDPLLYSFLYKQPKLQEKNGKTFLLQKDILSLIEKLSLRESFFFEEAGRFPHQEKHLFHLSSSKKQKGLSLIANGEEIELVYSNLPYSITSDFFVKLFRMFSSCSGTHEGVFLVQSEYAERILGIRPSSSIGVYLRNYASWKKNFSVSSSCFYPKPKVNSSLIEYKSHLKGPICSPLRLEKLLRLSFFAPRKKLRNNWKKGIPRHFPEISLDFLLDIASSEGISGDSRAEELSPEDFYALCKSMERYDLK